MIMHSEKIDEIAKAMSAFQALPMVIGVNATGYGYDYATLDKCVNRIYPKATALGLSIIQPLGESSDGSPAIITILMHTSGQWLQTAYPISGAGIKKANDAQQFGAAVTYARRYGLLAAFGVPAGKDDDAASLTEKPAAKKPAGKKYKASDPTPAESIIAEIGDCLDLEDLTKCWEKNKVAINDSPKKDQIVAEFSIQKGVLSERGKK